MVMLTRAQVCSNTFYDCESVIVKALACCQREGERLVILKLNEAFHLQSRRVSEESELEDLMLLGDDTCCLCLFPGLTESVIAAACSRVGQKVLHLDR